MMNEWARPIFCGFFTFAVKDKNKFLRRALNNEKKNLFFPQPGADLINILQLVSEPGKVFNLNL